jgi:hypothetical protein
MEDKCNANIDNIEFSVILRVMVCDVTIGQNKTNIRLNHDGA